MWFASLSRRVSGATVVGAMVCSTPLPAQPASATMEVMAVVTDIGTLDRMPFDPFESTASTATGGLLPSTSAFSIAAPLHSTIAVSGRLSDLSRVNASPVTMQVCRPSGAVGRCRSVAVAGTDATLAVVADGERLLARFPQRAEAASGVTGATITLAYTAN
ncbi:MAG: hypothetical protein OEY20_09350 [Gemmatimonadota bacterium]|nr:hypothetical protein [Gemmatimonadota bacterium]